MQSLGDTESFGGGSKNSELAVHGYELGSN